MEWLWNNLEEKFGYMADSIGEGFPFMARDGEYSDTSSKIPGGQGLFLWTNGFWPGMLWQMFYATKKVSYQELATALDKKLAQILQDQENLTHDLGFQFMLSAVAEYKITGNEYAKKNGILAADRLIKRFNSNGNFIQAWNKSHLSKHVEGWMIIDCMMNIQLLYWASEQTGNACYSEVASKHADTALKYLVREDGSCNHIVEFSPKTGKFITSHEGQGYDKDSAWSRGQAWAVYGFALCYRNTGEVRYLETAKKCANFCIANLAVNDWIPLCDFKSPEEPKLYDSSAGAILACGFHELSLLVNEHEKMLYRKAAEKVLLACANQYAYWGRDHNPIYLGSTLQYHGDAHKNIPAIYGDYYFMEAILRFTGKEMGMWYR